MKAAVDLWLDELVPQAPDWIQVEKRHGRIERRELWIVESSELGKHLEVDYRWPAVKWSGRIRRSRKKSQRVEWESIEETTWIAGGNLEKMSPATAAAWLRGYWTVENRIFWVRDVTLGEDRHHAHKIGHMLSALRNVVINIYRLLGYQYIPDGWRTLSADLERCLELLLSSNGLLEN